MQTVQKEGDIQVVWVEDDMQKVWEVEEDGTQEVVQACKPQ